MALAKPPDISTSGDSTLKGNVVKVKISIAIPVFISIIAALGLIGHRLSTPSQINDQPEYKHEAALQPEKPNLGDMWNDRNTNIARRFVKNIQAEKAVEPKPRITENMVGIWETHIIDYARSQALKDVDTTRMHKLAEETADLFQMLKEASKRKNEGMEPYTGFSGFSTMAVVMSIEKEFQEVLGVTFSDFMQTLDTDFIKKMAKSE